MIYIQFADILFLTWTLTILGDGTWQESLRTIDVSDLFYSSNGVKAKPGWNKIKTGFQQTGRKQIYVLPRVFIQSCICENLYLETEDVPHNELPDFTASAMIRLTKMHVQMKIMTVRELKPA